MLDMIPVEVLAAGGLFLGCFSRAILPFLKKKYEEASKGISIKWEGRYTWTFVFAIFTSFVTAMLLFPSFDIPSTNVFPLAFAMGWASQDILNTLVK